METKAYMYVLKCSDGTLYTGYTTNIQKRLAVHNSGKAAKYTRVRHPVNLLYYEEFPNKSAAMSQEAFFKKKQRTEKLAYLPSKKDDSLH